MKAAARRQGGQPRRDEHDRHPRPARLHHHHRGLRRLLRAGKKHPRGPARRSRPPSSRSRPPSARSSATRPTRCWSPSAPGARASMPGHDEHDPQPRPHRRSRSRAWPRRPATPASPTTATAAFIDMFGSTAWASSTSTSSTSCTRSRQEKGSSSTPTSPPTTSRNWSSGTRPSTRSTSASDFPQDPQKQLWLRHQRRLQLAGTATRRSSTAASSGSPALRAPPSTSRRWSSATWATTSGTGVAFTRDPNTGENVFYGDLPHQRPGRRRRRRHPHPRADRRQLEREDAQGLRAAHRHPPEARSSTTRRCRTSSSRCRTARCTCSRPAPASGPAPPRCGSPSRWSRRS